MFLEETADTVEEEDEDREEGDDPTGLHSRTVLPNVLNVWDMRGTIVIVAFEIESRAPSSLPSFASSPLPSVPPSSFNMHRRMDSTASCCWIVVGSSWESSSPHHGHVNSASVTEPLLPLRRPAEQAVVVVVVDATRSDSCGTVLMDRD